MNKCSVIKKTIKFRTINFGNIVKIIVFSTFFNSNNSGYITKDRIGRLISVDCSREVYSNEENHKNQRESGILYDLVQCFLNCGAVDLHRAHGPHNRCSPRMLLYFFIIFANFIYLTIFVLAL